MRESALLGPGPQVVAVVEHHRARTQESNHGLDVAGHGVVRPPNVVVRLARPQFGRFGRSEPPRDIATQGIVRAGLIGDHVGFEPAAEQLRKHVRGVAENPDRDGLA